MLVGVGIDLVETERMRRAIERGGARLLDRLFSPAEVRYCSSRRNPGLHYAARLAAKEALFKALGTGWSGGVSWRDAEVRLDEAGRPELGVGGRARALLDEAGVIRVHLSLTHTDMVAGAVVVLEGDGGHR